MSYQNIFKRYELKYLITKKQKKDLFELMEGNMVPDAFGKNIIRNLYFDTPNKLLIRRSMDKPCYKEKLRVRSYGITKENSVVFMELKKKYEGVVYKRRMDLPYQMAVNYLTQGRDIIKENQILKEIDYFISAYEEIEPSVFLSYEREAFVSQTDENFRMTFDENIFSRDYDLSLTQGIYGKSILSKEKVLLEVKTAEGLPRWLLDFLSQNKIYKCSFSKYGCAYEQLILPYFTEHGSFEKEEQIHYIIGGQKYVA